MPRSSKSETDQRPAAREAVVHGLHLLVLWSFAVAQPLFDLISAEPAFFVARRSQPADVVVLALVLTIVAPQPLVLLGLASRAAGRQVHRLVHGVLVIALLALIFLPPVHRWLGESSLKPILLVVALGMAGCWLYFRFAALHQYATWLLPALLLFPAFFLSNPGIRRIAFPAPPALDPAMASGSTTPLVLIIVDELPLVSLLNEERRIDPIRYPNLAGLAEEATWYPNATAVADYTSASVPAILTGKYPNPGLLPLIEDHPQNLFTLLGGSHELQVLETFTWLCPPSLCGGEQAGFPTRFRSLLSDLAVVYFHLVLPSPLTGNLPSVVQNWQDIGWSDRPTRSELRARNKEHFAADRGARFLRFVERIRRGRRPSFVYLHTSLPHAPWTFLPSGIRYPNDGEPAWGKKGHWVADEPVIAESYRRHLLQVGYVDALLGKLVQRLREVGLYDPSVIVVTSDHGMSFQPGGERRRLTLSNLGEILSVPLIVKAPFQTDPIIDERSFEAVDLLPTLAEDLGTKVPWRMDGKSIRDPATAQHRPAVAFRTKPAVWKRMVIQPHELELRFRSLDRKLRLLGPTGALAGPPAPTGFARLIGLETDAVEMEEVSDVRLGLPLPTAAFDLDPDLRVAPVRLSGTASRSGGAKGPFYLAVAVNGVVRAVTRVGEAGEPKGEAFFSFLVEELSFGPGRNKAEFFVPERRGDRFLLRRATAVFADS